ncbi:MAG: patatin-like phospholipase family protein [Ktedonobacterales bacterium]
MHTKKTGTRALVLGGGSVAGVAWELGMITGLREMAVDVRDADLIIGTSAGSLVSAQISSGTDLESLFASQLTPVEPATERKEVPNLERTREVFSQAQAETGSGLKALRARIGAYALAAPTVSEEERRAYIAAQLPSHTWPEQHLLLVSVDTATGEEFLMDRESQG